MSSSDEQRWEDLVDREMLGEALSEEDRHFRGRYESENEEARLESLAWGGMMSAVEEESDAEGRSRTEALANRVLVQRDVERGVVVAMPERSKTSPKTWVGLATLAAAAAVVAIVVPSESDTPTAIAETTSPDADPSPVPNPAQSGLPVPAKTPTVAEAPLAPGLLALAGEGLLLDGGPASAGSSLIPGQRITFDTESDAEGAGGCVVFDEPWIAACVSRGSDVVFDPGERAGHRSALLQRGRMVVSADQLSEGQDFTVVTSKGEIAAIGTAFEVWVDAQGSVTASSLGGTVRVSVPGSEPLELGAGESVKLGGTEVERLGADALAWSRSHAQLASLWRASERGVIDLQLPDPAGDSSDLPSGDTAGATLDALGLGAAPLSLLAPQGEHLVALVGSSTGIPVTVEAGTRQSVALVDPERERKGTRRPAARRTPVSALVRKAIEARADHRYADASKYLERILELYPAGPDAQNARVELGDLLREKLGNPRRALTLYDGYLSRGGPLSPEARYGRIRALSRLSQSGAEQKAIESFLAKHPGDWRAAELRERLGTLAAP